MKGISLAVSGFLMAVVVPLLPAHAQERAKAPKKLAQAKVEAARKTYEVVWKNNREGIIPFAELVYRWSERWMRAELELSDKMADRAAAYQAHLDRMRELARITRERFRNRINTIEEVSASEYYIAEATLWIEQAKNK